MKNICIFLSGLIACYILCVSCSDDAENSASVPTVTDFYPKDGEVTDQITIEGANFGVNRLDADGHVYFNGVEAADYISYADNQIVVTVPRGVVTGPITVRRGNQRARTTDRFVLRTDDPLWGYDKGTFEQYFFAEDVVHHTGKSNLCNYIYNTDGREICIGESKNYGSGAPYQPNAGYENTKPEHFALWDSEPGDMAIFQVEIPTPGGYYVAFKASSGMSNSYINVAISQDLESLKESSSAIDNKYSKDVENTGWANYSNDLEFGYYLLEVPGTYYVKLLMMNADMSASAVATPKFIKMYN